MSRGLKILLIAFSVFLLLGVAFMGLYGIKDGKSVLGNIQKASKKVESIYEGTSYDIVFLFEGDNNIYYINRGVQYGLNVEELRNKYLGKVLEFTRVGYTKKGGGHISKLVYQDSVVYNEFK